MQVETHTPRTFWSKYVIHSQIADHEAKGWKRCDGLIGTHHGHYAIVMTWEGDGEPPK